MESFTSFIERNKIKLSILSRPIQAPFERGRDNGERLLAELRRKDPDGGAHMDLWRIRLEAPNGKGIETDYRKGIGLRTKRTFQGATIDIPYRGDRKYLPFHILSKRGLTIADVEELSSYFPEDPTAGEIISSLASDVREFHNGGIGGIGFDTWVKDLGYDPDSRKAETTYRLCARFYLELRSMLGGEVLSELLTIDPD